MKLARLEVLSDAEIQHIHAASLDILASCGVKIDSPHMLAFLEGKGFPSTARLASSASAAPVLKMPWRTSRPSSRCTTARENSRSF